MVDDLHTGRFMIITILITVLLVWSWAWTLDQDPAFPDVGKPAWVPPAGEPTNVHGANIFWSGAPNEDTIFFHGVLATPPENSR